MRLGLADLLKFTMSAGKETNQCPVFIANVIYVLLRQ